MLSKSLVIPCLIVALLLVTSISSQAAGTEAPMSSIRDLYVKHVKMKRKLVALTFDDGPDPRYTPKIIEELNKFGAKGTFFVIGMRAKRYPDLLKLEIANGDEIGNHSLNHRLTKLIQIEDIEGCDQVVFDATNHHTRLFRPPGGFISKQILDSASKANETVVTWSWDEDSRDWSKPGVSKIVNRVLNHLHPGDIILFHDGGGKRDQTIEALPKILEGIREQGFQCVTVSELIQNFGGT
ncbi:polysaccharide deacetylase family protein [Fodinisporobacter ferrooxydans]|uniref:Polysaccharide deacetylase family protein n=1 Tax=Fodinisporobacter ferrooxydans TaxID=2901836 RepID=A0ABY4CK18_9BACL|nr:polysaccharide deacetylase family protein [Alicyclobacillaceae bacterium MYW30-H2]